MSSSCVLTMLSSPVTSALELASQVPVVKDVTEITTHFIGRHAQFVVSTLVSYNLLVMCIVIYAAKVKLRLLDALLTEVLELTEIVVQTSSAKPRAVYTLLVVGLGDDRHESHDKTRLGNMILANVATIN